MILAFHSIFTTYGTWLPNEPRGSWSTFVASWELYRFDKATTVNTRRSIAGNTYDINVKKQMQRALKYPPVRFTGTQAHTIAMAFAKRLILCMHLRLCLTMFTWLLAIQGETSGTRSGIVKLKQPERYEEMDGLQSILHGRIMAGMCI